MCAYMCVCVIGVLKEAHRETRMPPCLMEAVKRGQVRPAGDEEMVYSEDAPKFPPKSGSLSCSLEEI